MTIQEAYKKIISSEDLRKKANEAIKTGKGDEFLKEQGINYTIDQFKEAFNSMKKELTKAELDKAAGGSGQVPLPPEFLDKFSINDPKALTCRFFF